MFATIVLIALLGLSFLGMAFGGILAGFAAYGLLVIKGRSFRSRAERVLCGMGLVVGLLIFALAAAVFVPLVMR